MPIDTISSDQRVFIQAIINEIIMLFIILNSSYYKNDSNIDEEKMPPIKGKKIYPIAVYS